jgi:hypothetical protein
MALEGKTQAEIGMCFHRCERTIHDWIKKAKRRCLVTMKGTRPEDMLAQTFFEFAQMRADLLSAKSQAKEAGDTAAVVVCTNQLRHLAMDQYRIAEKAGYLDGKFSEPAKRKGEIEVDLMVSMIEHAILGTGGNRFDANMEKLRARDRALDDDDPDDDLY